MKIKEAEFRGDQKKRRSRKGNKRRRKCGSRSRRRKVRQETEFKSECVESTINIQVEPIRSGNTWIYELQREKKEEIKVTQGRRWRLHLRMLKCSWRENNEIKEEIKCKQWFKGALRMDVLSGVNVLATPTGLDSPSHHEGRGDAWNYWAQCPRASHRWTPVPLLEHETVDSNSKLGFRGRNMTAIAKYSTTS